MRLQIHLRIKNHKLLLQAFLIRTQKMILLKVYLKRVVIDVVLLLSASVTAIADMAALVLVSAMRVKFVVAIEPLGTETAFRMTLEPALVYCAWVVVARSLVLFQFGGGKELVLVCEDLLIPCTEIT